MDVFVAVIIAVVGGGSFANAVVSLSAVAAAAAFPATAATADGVTAAYWPNFEFRIPNFEYRMSIKR